MRWLGRVALLAVAALIGIGAWWFWPRQPLPARFALESCRKVALTDRATGAPIVGAEDLVLYEGDTLFLAAYDRLAAETAAVEGRTPPDGGIYRVSTGALDRVARLTLTNEVDPARMRDGLHPHGLDARLAKLVFVNRAVAAEGTRGTELRVMAIREDGLEPLRRVRNPGLCAANDVYLAGQRVDVTFDRAACPGLSLDEALFPEGKGRVAQIGVADYSSGAIGRVEEGFTYPNGVVRVRIGGDYPRMVAETRAERLHREGMAPVALPGGPDNLTVDAEGQIVAALHPQMLRLALYRGGWIDRAPSRIARVNPETGATEILFDDPEGAVFSAATAAVLAGGMLVAGSVRDAGLLVCGRP